MLNKGIYYKSLIPDEIVCGCVCIYENAWENCQQTIDILEKEANTPNTGVSWNRATTIDHGIYQSHRTNLDLGITYSIEAFHNTEIIPIQNTFYNLINSAMSDYSKRFNIKEHWYHEYYNALKYTPGSEYLQHYDGGTNTCRHVSCLLYLNNDYSGGELEFNNFNLKITPQPGMLLLFPSNFAYSHTARPVISGTKYALVTWLHDSPLN